MIRLIERLRARLYGPLALTCALLVGALIAA